MKAVQSFIGALMIIAMLSSGLPLFIREDANRDAQVTLEDAIINLQMLTRTIEQPEGFKANFKNAVHTFKLLAGLSRTIKYNPNSKSTSFFHELPFLLTSNEISPHIYNRAFIYAPEVLHGYIVFAPNPPPPEVPIAYFA